MSDVIVIGSNYSTALGTVRAVGMAGFGVRLLATTHECAEIIGNSRFIVKTITCMNDYQAFYDAMERLRADDTYLPVIPTSDLSTLLLDKHADALWNHYCFPNINHTQGEIARWMDKLRQKQLAKSCGLAVAEGKAYPATEDGMKEALSEAYYPCITKAIASEDCIGSKELCHICNEPSDLQAMIGMAIHKQCSYMLVEQLLDIEKEYAVYGLAFNGKVAMPACVETWRSGHGAHKGVTAEGVMLNADFLGEDKIKLEEFVRQCGLNGLFCVDVIHSKGRNYFVEMNLRYGASGYAATMGGANLPGIFAHLMVHGGELDETVQLRYEPQFLSEKVELDDFRVGFMSWREYKKHQKGDKIFFIKSKEDPEPWKQFRRLEKKKRLARLLRGTKRSI